MAPVKRRKLASFEHVARHGNLSRIILEGTLEGGRRYSRQRKRWMDNIKEWTSLSMPELLTTAPCRKKRLEGDLCGIVRHFPPPPPAPDDVIDQETELNWTELL